MSPKVPIFESEVSITPKGPSTLVDTDTYAIMGRGLGALYRDEATLWGEVGKAGSALAEVGQKIQQAQDAAQVSKAIGQSYTDLGNLQLEYAGKPEKYTVTDPNTGQSRVKTWEEVRDSIDPEIQTLKTNIMQNLSPIGRMHFEGHFDRLAAQKKINILGHAQKRDIEQIKGDAWGTITSLTESYANEPDETIRGQIYAQIQGKLALAKAANAFTPIEIAKLAEHAKDSMEYHRALKMNDEDPIAFNEQLKDKSFLSNLKPELKEQVKRRNDFDVRRIQNDTYSDLVLRISKSTGKNPDPNVRPVTIEENQFLLTKQRITPGEFRTVEGLLKSKGDESDRETWGGFAVKVLNLPVDEKTPVIGEKLADDIISNPNLGVKDKINLYGSVRDKINKAQTNASQLDEGLVKSMKDVMDENHYKMFLYDFYNDPKGYVAMPKDIPAVDKGKYIREFATPYWQKSNQAYAEKAVGKKGKTWLEQEEKGGGKVVPGKMKPSMKVPGTTWWK